MRYRALSLAVTLVSLFLVAGCSKQESPTTSVFPESAGLIKLRFDPTPPVGAAESKVYVRLIDAAGNSISGAVVNVTLVMPAMPSMGMAEMRTSKDLTWNGKEYEAIMNIPMAGDWKATVKAVKNEKRIATHNAEITAK